MALSLTSPVTGGAQTGFTAPTYTLTADIAPDQFGKQWAVTGLGGTQAGVISHSASAPFTITMVRPRVLRFLPQGLLTTSIIKNLPFNKWKLIVRKAVTPASGQPIAIATVKVEFAVPAGADAFDSTNVRAMLSLAIGALSQNSAGYGDSCVSGLA